MRPAPACGAALAPDQRYCVECGQRHGRSDLPFAPVALEYEDTPTEKPHPARARMTRMTTNSAFIGLVGVLLLALGVGVLIGRAGNASASKTNPPVQVVTVAAGGGAPAAGSTAGTSAGSTPAAGTSPAASAPGQTAKATTNATSSSTATSTTVTKAVETTRPLSGPNRPGYHNGKFTGNFFGP